MGFYCNHLNLIEVSDFPFYDGANIFRDLCEHLMQLFLANCNVGHWISSDVGDLLGTGLVSMWVFSV